MSSDPVHDFLAAMEAAGLRPAEPIARALADGGIVRFQEKTDRLGRKNGWAVLFLDGPPAGRFGHFRLNVDQTWSGANSHDLGADERHEVKRRWRDQVEQHQARKTAIHTEAASRAIRLWESSVPANPHHPFLVRKGMDGEGLRQRSNMLVVPRRDIDDRLWSLQFIDPAGEKRFLKGGRSAGLMLLVGEVTDTLCIGEGVSTMAAVRAATGHPTASAFSAANLEKVARAARARWPGADLIICADDDAHLVDHPTISKNLGLDYARTAAAAVGGRLAIPPRGA